MSTAFTSPANQSWQTLLNEITTAYSERRQALGQSAYISTDGTDVQAVAYWVALQNWLETNCTSYVDHVLGPVNPVEPRLLLYFTLLNWRSAATLNASGFRRSVDGTTFLYGQMQAGDIIGPWIFEDLQKGFSALKWTIIFPVISNPKEWTAYKTGDFSCEDLRSQVMTLWNATSWIDSSGVGYAVQVEHQFDGGIVRTIGAWRYKITLTTTIPITNPCSVDYYGWFAAVGSGDVFTDFDHLGLTENVQSKFASSAEEQTANRVIELGAYDTCPLDDLPLICGITELATYACRLITPWAIIKWNFTNA